MLGLKLIHVSKRGLWYPPIARTSADIVFISVHPKYFGLRTMTLNPKLFNEPKQTSGFINKCAKYPPVESTMHYSKITWTPWRLKSPAIRRYERKHKRSAFHVICHVTRYCSTTITKTEFTFEWISNYIHYKVWGPIPNFNRCNRERLGMDKDSHPAPYLLCDYLYIYIYIYI